MCGTEDTVKHMLCHSPRFATARQGNTWVLDQWEVLPTQVTHHLIAPANPHSAALRADLHLLGSGTNSFQSLEATGGCQHLFTDGSCFYPENEDLSIAAWSLVNASTGKVLACSPLAGQLQTVNRAEITAALAACKWVVKTRCHAVLWSDSLHVCHGVADILQHGMNGKCAANHDLWAQVAQALECIPQGALQIQHAPAHLSLPSCETPFEEWLSLWNGRADLQARLANTNRTTAIAELHCKAVKWDEHMTQCLRALREVYMAIADCQAKLRYHREEEGVGVTDMSLPLSDPQVALSDEMPVGWRQVLRAKTTTLPSWFIEDLVSFVCQQDQDNVDTFSISWLELLFALHLHTGDGKVSFPVYCSVSGSWQDGNNVPFGEVRLTASVQLRLVRDAMSFALNQLGLSSVLVDGLNCLEIGVHFPLKGFCAGFDPLLLSKARAGIADWAAARPIRSAADLARPLH